MKNLKGFPKLTIQIVLLSASMIALSFVTETDFYSDFFCSEYTGMEIDRGDNFNADWYSRRYRCKHDFCKVTESNHLHWNYRGWIYFFTGFAFFILSVVKIITSHKEEDFTINK
tara:strand:+ start:114 stop:455 length:342 start_codon:yes stop_codon:yes gene_type:complete